MTKNNNTAQKGGRVSMPLQYFQSGLSNLYSCLPNVNLNSVTGYGPVNAVSHGVVNSDGTATGPNLAPFPKSSGLQTGGAKKRRSKKSKKSRKANKKSRKAGKKSGKSHKK